MKNLFSRQTRVSQKQVEFFLAELIGIAREINQNFDSWDFQLGVDAGNLKSHSSMTVHFNVKIGEIIRSGFSLITPEVRIKEVFGFEEGVFFNSSSDELENFQNAFNKEGKSALQRIELKILWAQKELEKEIESFQKNLKEVVKFAQEGSEENLITVLESLVVIIRRIDLFALYHTGVSLNSHLSSVSRYFPLVRPLESRLSLAIKSFRPRFVFLPWKKGIPSGFYEGEVNIDLIAKELIRNASKN